jgi:hypothetical protein
MAGVTDAGFVRKLEAEVIDELVAEARATVDPAFDDSPDSVTGQITGIVGSKIAELWEVLDAVYGTLSENASGVALDRIGALTGSTRKPGESDAAFRIRRRLELADAGATTQGALQAALSKLEGMLSAAVFSNRSMVVDGAGRPPKSVEAVVRLETVDDAHLAAVASTLWQNLPAGIEAYGTHAPVGIDDEQGNTQTLRFSLATAESPYVRVSITADATRYEGDEALRTALVAFVSGERDVTSSDGAPVVGPVGVGGTLYRSRLSAAASTVPGVVAVRRIETSADGATWVDADLVLSPRGYLALETAHIQVVRT